MSKILFTTSEAHPLVKTGGLGDVSASLPPALVELGEEVRIVLPAYRQLMERVGETRSVARLTIIGALHEVEILEGRFPGTEIPLWLVSAPEYFDRDGGPYSAPDGHDWIDNPQRFALFARAVVELAMDRAGLGWKSDLVHCNDWQTGLVPALLSLEMERPATVFTIHNLAYQGLFPSGTFHHLHLPAELWSHEGLEFHDMLSFIKGGLAYADKITTVSPTYAREIRTAEFGYGLEGLLNHRVEDLVGILNGVDYDIWDPKNDDLIPRRYDIKSVKLKVENKLALQREFQLDENEKIPLLGFVGRMVEQKGIDLILEVLPEILQRNVQCVILGSGEKHFEHAFTEIANQFPGKLGVRIGYNETLSHLIEAGSDIFLMPSRFEPCGLNQIYSLRYGTIPVVRNTGGLADTVIDANDEARMAGMATGFKFEHATVHGLLWALSRALELYPRPRLWRTIVTTAMEQDFSWQSSAQHYIDLYRQIID